MDVINNSDGTISPLATPTSTNLWTLWIVLLFAILGFTWIYSKFHNAFNYWNARNIPVPRPILPILGNSHLFFQNQPNRGLGDIKRVQTYGKIFGYYLGLRPVLVIADPPLIRQVLIKDFAKCMNRQYLKTYHPNWNLSLFIAENDTWKRIRTITTPAFTIARIRAMNGLMYNCVQMLTKHLDTVVLCDGSTGTGTIPDLKHMFMGFTIDVIAATSFATETNANADPQNSFVFNGTKLFQFGLLRGFISLIAPAWFNSLIGIRTFFDPKPFEFFIQYSKEVISQRLRLMADETTTTTTTDQQQQPPPKPNDFVQLLIDAWADEEAILTKDNVHKFAMDYDDNGDDEEEEVEKDNSKSSTTTTGIQTKKLSEDEIIAQCLLFFSAGFETTASTLFHCVYELALNPSIQERLYQTLSETLEKISGVDNEKFGNDDDDDQDDPSKRINIKLLEQLITTDLSPYLEAVIKETLRKYPPVTVLFRRVSHNGYCIPGVDGPLDKDVHIEIPIYAIHHTAEYYPEPDRFNPDRFMPENRHHLVSYTYLPFGAGPRNCVGMRLAYQEMKLALATLVLRGYYFTPHPRDTPKVAPQFKSGGAPFLSTQTFPLCVSKRKRRGS